MIKVFRVIWSLFLFVSLFGGLTFLICLVKNGGIQNLILITSFTFSSFAGIEELENLWDK